MSIKYLIIALVMTLPLNGFAGQVSNLPEKRPLRAELPTYQAAENGNEEIAFAQLPETAALTLDQALTLALARSPGLAAFSWKIKASQGVTEQENLLPNPEIGVVVENILGEGESRGVQAADTTLQLNQLLELGGKRGKRQEIANLEHDLAGWDYEASRLDIIAETSKAFFALLTAQEKVELGQENLELAKEVYNTVKLRVEAGKASPLEESRAQIVVSKNRIALNKYNRELAAARYQLTSTWGADQPHFKKAVAKKENIKAPPTFNSISPQLRQNPEIARQDTEIARQRARLNLAQAAAIPDLTVGGGIKRHEAQDNYTFLVGFSMALPIFNRNQGGISSTRAEINVKESTHQNLNTKLRNALQQNHEKFQAAYSEVNSLQNQILPTAEKTFAAIRYGYRQGQFALLDVLDAQRTLIELKEQLTDALQEYHNQRLSIERLISQKL